MNKEQPKIEQKETGTIKGIAERVIQGNPGYSTDLLELIPEELLNTDATNENLQEVADKLDIIRSKKEREIKFLFNVAASILHQ